MKIDESEKLVVSGNIVHMEDCEGRWLSSCHSSVVEHCQTSWINSWMRLPVFRFPLFSPHNIKIFVPSLLLCVRFLVAILVFLCLSRGDEVGENPSTGEVGHSKRLGDVSLSA